MASGYTANYGLCQWQPGDKFLREEFNQDNGKIDEALKAAEDKAAADTQAAQQTADRALTGLEAADYNIYNLLLQNEYEGKYTGYKKALLYDGFSDESRIASKSSDIQINAQAARLSKSGQGNISSSSTGNTCFLGDKGCTTGIQTAVGNGTLTGVQFQYNPSDSFGCATNLVVYHNGVYNSIQQVTLEGGSGGMKTVTLQKPLSLVKGDTFYLELECNSSSRSAYIYLNSSGYMAGTIYITPVGSSSGTITAKGATITGGGTQALVFVRYDGGSVTPRINGAALSRTARRTTTDVKGRSCTEDTYEGTWSSGTLTASFTMDCGSGSSCVFYGYGMVLL